MMWRAMLRFALGAFFLSFLWAEPFASMCADFLFAAAISAAVENCYHSYKEMRAAWKRSS